MASFLFNPIGTAGDVHPYVAIAGELKKRGHRVRFLSTPNNAELAEGAGLEFLPLGEPLANQNLASDPRLRRPYSAWKAAMQWAALGMMKSVYDEIDSLSKTESLTVIAPLWSLGARMARETSPMRLVQLVMNPCLLRSAESPALLPMLPMPRWTPVWFKRWQYRLADRIVLDPILAPQLNHFRKSLGLMPVQRVMNRWWYSPDTILGLFSEKFAPKPNDWPTAIELVGHTLWDPEGDSNEVRRAVDFVKCNPGAIAIVPGSAGPGDTQLLPNILKACHSIHRPAILLSPLQHPEIVGMPGRWHHCCYAPLATILPHCALVIHRACIGTSCQTLAAGLPHLSMPSVNDQFDNARRLERMQVSTTIKSNRNSVNEFVSNLQKILADTAVQSRCSSLRALHNKSSVLAIADRLEAIENDSTLRSTAFRQRSKNKAAVC